MKGIAVTQIVAGGLFLLCIGSDIQLGFGAVLVLQGIYNLLSLTKKKK